MQPIREVSYTLPSKPEGEVPVYDATQAIAKVVFNQQASRKQGKGIYQVLVNGKQLVYSSGSSLQFGGSREFVLKLKEDLVKIVEKDATGKTKVFVDQNKRINTKILANNLDIPSIPKGEAYVVSFYKTREMNLAEVKQKILATTWPNLKDAVVVFNRYGIAVFEENSGDVLFFASPSQNKLDELKFRGGRVSGTTFAKSMDGKVHFQKLPEDSYLLNGEGVTSIRLNQILSEKPESL